MAILPHIPEIGHPESYYTAKVREAERVDDSFARECAKVGQYITLALQPDIEWAQKLRYFQSTLQRHCNPPNWADVAVQQVYQQMADVVRDHCGAEALRLASAEDDVYAVRVGVGTERGAIEDDADAFFSKLIPPTCPRWFHPHDYAQLVMIRDQWI